MDLTRARCNPYLPKWNFMACQAIVKRKMKIIPD